MKNKTQSASQPISTFACSVELELRIWECMSYKWTLSASYSFNWTEVNKVYQSVRIKFSTNTSFFLSLILPLNHFISFHFILHKFVVFYLEIQSEKITVYNKLIWISWHWTMNMYVRVRLEVHTTNNYTQTRSNSKHIVLIFWLSWYGIGRIEIEQQQSLYDWFKYVCMLSVVYREPSWHRLI